VTLKRGDTVWFWYRGTRVRAYVHKVKGGDVVVYLAGQRVQLPKLRARPISTFPTADVGEG
jgi:hypothetical protein